MLNLSDDAMSQQEEIKVYVPRKPQDQGHPEEIHLNDDDLKAANRVRMHVASGICFICLDDRPNIATLCCGKAVHFNCMAKWLKEKSSCPQCRENFPDFDASIFYNDEDNDATVLSDDGNSLFEDDGQAFQQSNYYSGEEDIQYPRRRRPFEPSLNNTIRFQTDVSNFDPRRTDDPRY